VAGTLDVNETNCWMPAGWVFDAVLESVAVELESSDPAFAKQWIRASTEGGTGYLDLRPVERGRFELAVAAVERVLAKAEEEGPERFAQPEFFGGFIKQLKSLNAMLNSDPRRSITTRKI
jgi:hypothetical protein